MERRKESRKGGRKGMGEKDRTLREKNPTVIKLEGAIKFFFEAHLRETAEWIFISYPATKRGEGATKEKNNFF